MNLLNHNARWLVIALLLVGCETTRDNTQTVKARVRNIAVCNVPDRCGVMP